MGLVGARRGARALCCICGPSDSAAGGPDRDPGPSTPPQTARDRSLGTFGSKSSSMKQAWPPCYSKTLILCRTPLNSGRRCLNRETVAIWHDLSLLGFRNSLPWHIPSHIWPKESLGPYVLLVTLCQRSAGAGRVLTHLAERHSISTSSNQENLLC